MPAPIIAFPSDLNDQLKEFLLQHNYSQTGLLMDGNTEEFCYPLIKNALPDSLPIVVRAGEEQKNIETCVQVWEKLTDFAFDRHSLLIILGGGVLGDLGGFCASTYKRGIDFLLIPTTLLAQADASIGGKLGIDFRNFKNHIGLFQEPVATYIFSPFLKSLPGRELRSGFAEVVKHCIISDEAMWDKVRTLPLDRQDWNELIPHSTAFKRGVVDRDPRESGLRKILNFGHSIGHAIEGYFLSKGNPIFHGEAVAAGMIAESFIAFDLGLISGDELAEISGYLKDVFGLIELPEAENEIISRMRQDKKNQANKILLALPKGIGDAVWDIEVSERKIADAVKFYRSQEDQT